jgi:hypothetical protein
MKLADLLRKLVLVIFLIAFTSVAQGNDAPNVTYPRLIRYANRLEKFVPKGWRLERKRIGDLNHDRLPDAVLVMRQNNPNNVLDNPEGMGVDKLDTNPRIVLVVFARASGGYQLMSNSHDLIPRNLEPVNDDPFEDVVLKANTFKVVLHFFASAGTWYTSQTSFLFRYQNGCVRLIGYDQSEYQRNTGQTSETSVNYLTGKIKKNTETQPSIFEVKWSTLKTNPKMCLENLGDGWDFDPELVKK